MFKSFLQQNIFNYKRVLLTDQVFQTSFAVGHLLLHIHSNFPTQFCFLRQSILTSFSWAWAQLSELNLIKSGLIKHQAWTTNLWQWWKKTVEWILVPSDYREFFSVVLRFFHRCFMQHCSWQLVRILTSHSFTRPPKTQEAKIRIVSSHIYMFT